MRWSLLSLVPVTVLVGCFSPNYGNAGFTCGEAGECPSGYECQSDGICHRDGTGVDLPDADPAAPDGNPNAPDADPAAPDASVTDASIAPDALPTPDAGPAPDAQLQPNSCDSPGLLEEGVEAQGTVINAGDELDLSCSGADGNDAVHGLTTDAVGDILVALNPQSDWNLRASLRTEAGCETTADLNCVPGAYQTRYLQSANQPAGNYNVVIDGETDGNFAIRYETRPVDTGYGYWQQRGAGAYVALSGADVQEISISNNFDEVSFSVNLPFGFEFYGDAKNSINIHTNGFASFDALPGGFVLSNYSNDCPLDATTPFNIIAPFWDDLYPVSGGGGGGAVSASTLKYEFQGVAPYRRLVVEWGNWNVVQSAPCPGAGCLIHNTGISHQAILYEGGDIEFRYGPRNASSFNGGCSTPEFGCSATVGLRNANGSDNDGAGCNQANLIDDGTVIYFVHPR